MSHTKGPWRADGHAVEARCFTGEWKWICDKVRGGSPQETEANLRLICTAPELWEAAKDIEILYAELMSGKPFDLTNPAWDMVQAAVRNARAAIAATTGGTE